MNRLMNFWREGDGDSFWRTRIVVGSLLLAFITSQIVAGIALAGSSYTENGWQLVTPAGNVTASSYSDCLARWRARPDPIRQATYYCRQKLVTKYVADAPPPPPPTCTSPKPADETRAGACPAGTTGTWSQTRAYVTAAYPTCWSPGPWVPEAAPAGTCATPPPADPPPANAIVVNPGESISAAVAKLSPGGTVIVRPGTYAAFSLKACTAAAWCTIKAETDGTVEVAGLNIGGGNWYTSIEGFKFSGGSSKAVTGNYVKLIRDAFTGGPTSGNTSLLQIGTNDKTPGADHVLVEDSWVYGPGGRYKILVYNATNVVLRRNVTRWDAGYKNSDGAPQADITIYDSANVAAQNNISLDALGNGGAYVATFYNALNCGTSTKNANRLWQGNIKIGGVGYYMGTEGQCSVSGQVVENGLGIGGSYGVSQLKGDSVVYRNMTLLDSAGDGFGIFGGSATISNSVTSGQKGRALNGSSCSSCSTTRPANVLDGGGTGATILKRYGVSGTLYGEPGFDKLTDEPLWPWPNEARIKADFDSVRPAFGGKSLTEYVKAAAQ